MTDKEVKKGNAATVTCTLTGLGAGVTISWFSPDDSTNPLSDGDAGECSARNLQKCCLHVNDFTRCRMPHNFETEVVLFHLFGVFTN